MSQDQHITIPQDHPAIPGHFPGNPVVPGVIILQEVIKAIHQSESQTIAITGSPLSEIPLPTQARRIIVYSFGILFTPWEEVFLQKRFQAHRQWNIDLPPNGCS